MAIPRIIHQVWEGRIEPEMPIRLKILARTWREKNPDWEYHLWNGDEMDKLVETYFPEYLSMYKSFPYNVQRWDAIRYMILYVYGGVYTDLDTECFKPIDSLVENVTMGIGEEPPINNMPSCKGNAFLVSVKECSGWLMILDDIKNNTDNYKSSALTIMNTTGPFMIERLFKCLEREHNALSLSYLQVAPVSKYDMYNYIFENGQTLFQEKIKEAYCAHYFFGSWDNRLSFYNKV